MSHPTSSVEPGIQLSTHTQVRCQQRGITRQVQNLLSSWADRHIPVGSGATSSSLSSAAMQEMRAEGVSPQAIDRLQYCYIIASGSLAITVIKGRGGKNLRYRRRVRTHERYSANVGK